MKMKRTTLLLPPWWSVHQAATGVLHAGLYLADAVLTTGENFFTIAIDRPVAFSLQRKLRREDHILHLPEEADQAARLALRQALETRPDALLLAYWPPSALATLARYETETLARLTAAGLPVLATVDGAFWEDGIDAELKAADAYRTLEAAGVRFLGISQATAANSPVRIWGTVRQGGLMPRWTATVCRRRARVPRLARAFWRRVVWWGRPVPEKGLAEVVQICELAGLEPVLLPGASTDMLARYLARAAAVLYWPQRPYPGSMALLEAQAAGVPVVARDIGGLAEYVAPGNGLTASTFYQAAEALRTVRRAAPDPVAVRARFAAVRGPAPVVLHLRRTVQQVCG